MIEGLLVRNSLESSCFVLEQDTFIRCFTLVQPRKTGNHPDMAEKFVNWDVKHQC